MRVDRIGLLLLLPLAACGGGSTRTWNTAEAPRTSPTVSSEARATAPANVLDAPNGGCPPAAEGADPVCAAAMALPLTSTPVPTKLGAPLPGGKVNNRSRRDVYAIGSIGGGAWEIVRIPAAASAGGEVLSADRYMTRDLDWVTATPPVADASGSFTYAPTAVGVKIFDSGELNVVDRPGGGVRFDLKSGALPNRIASVAEMNGGSPVVYTPRR